MKKKIQETIVETEAAAETTTRKERNELRSRRRGSNEI